jgi:hypothetical protein
MQDSLAGRTPQIDRIGISYMISAPGNRRKVPAMIPTLART